MNQDELVSVPREQFEMLLIKANMELLQRVNHLVELLEQEIEKASEE